jgi:hypothetical protein
MTIHQVLRPCSFLLLCAAVGCATPGNVTLRPDGSPGPEKCSEEALQAMRILGLRVGDGASVELDVNQADDSPITLYDGPVESMLYESLGPLPPATRLYGRVWTGGPQAVVRYYEAHPPDREKIPICAAARTARGQMKKRPESKPGTAVLEFSTASAFIVESFR